MLKVRDFVIVRRITDYETPNAKESIGRAGRVYKIDDKYNLPIFVEYLKPLENGSTSLQYAEEELEKIPERDVLAYMI